VNGKEKTLHFPRADSRRKKKEIAGPNYLAKGRCSARGEARKNTPESYRRLLRKLGRKLYAHSNERRKERRRPKQRDHEGESGSEETSGRKRFPDRQAARKTYFVEMKQHRGREARGQLTRGKDTDKNAQKGSEGVTKK